MSSTGVSVPNIGTTRAAAKRLCRSRQPRHYLGKWDSTASKERYAAFVAELAACPSVWPSAPLTTPAQITVVELAAAYLDFAARATTGRVAGSPSQVHIVSQALRQLRNSTATTRPPTSARWPPASSAADRPGVGPQAD